MITINEKLMLMFGPLNYDKDYDLSDNKKSI